MCICLFEEAGNAINDPGGQRSISRQWHVALTLYIVIEQLVGEIFVQTLIHYYICHIMRMRMNEQRIPNVCLQKHFTTIYVFTQVFLIPNKHMSFTNRAVSDF